MKIGKLKIYEKVLFLLCLICLSSVIKTNKDLNSSLSSFRKFSSKAFNANSKKKFSVSNAKKFNSDSNLENGRSSFISLSKRTKYSKAATTKSIAKKSSSAFKRTMRLRTKWEFFNKLTEFFHGLKEKYTGEDKDKKPDTSNMKLYDQTKLQAENFILKTIWEQTLSKVKDFEKIVQKISFTVNNPITALLFKVQETVFKEDPNLKYAKVEKRKIPLDIEKPKEKTDAEKKDSEKTDTEKTVAEKQAEDETKKKENKKGKFKQLLETARVKGIEFIEKSAINAVESFVQKQFEGVYIGFFKTMLIEFSPISMINIQDSVVLGQIQNQVTQALSENSVSKSEEQLTVTVNDFINSTVDACKSYSNIKDVSKNFIERIMKFLSTNFVSFKKLIKYLNHLVKKAKGIADEEVVPKSILKKGEKGIADNSQLPESPEVKTAAEENSKNKKSVKFDEDLNTVYEFIVDEDITLWSQIRALTYQIWTLVKDEILMFFDSMKKCVSTYNENFVKFLPRAKVTFAVSIIGGILDGFIKHIPGVSQIIGLINSVMGVYTTWRIFTFGAIDLSIGDSRKIDGSLLGAKLARFVSSNIRGAFGLLNIPGVENFIKVAYHVYLIVADSWKKAGGDSDSKFIKVKDFFLNFTGISITKSTFNSFYSNLKKSVFGRKLRKYYK